MNRGRSVFAQLLDFVPFSEYFTHAHTLFPRLPTEADGLTNACSSAWNRLLSLFVREMLYVRKYRQVLHPLFL